MGRGSDHIRSIVESAVTDQVLPLFQSSPESLDDPPNPMEECCQEVLRRLEDIQKKLDKLLKDQTTNDPTDEDKTKEKVKKLIKKFLEDLFNDLFKDRPTGGSDLPELPWPQLPIPDPIFIEGGVDLFPLWDVFVKWFNNLVDGASSQTKCACLDELKKIDDKLNHIPTYDDTALKQAVKDVGEEVGSTHSDLLECCSNMGSALNSMQTSILNELSQLRGLL